MSCRGVHPWCKQVLEELYNMVRWVQEKTCSGEIIEVQNALRINRDNINCMVEHSKTLALVNQVSELGEAVQTSSTIR